MARQYHDVVVQERGLKQGAIAVGRPILAHRSIGGVGSPIAKDPSVPVVTCFVLVRRHSDNGTLASLRSEPGGQELVWIAIVSDIDRR